VNAPAPAPGTPRFAGNRVYWGPGFVDLASGSYQLLEDAVPEAVPDGGDFPNDYAWSPGGERLLACFSSGTRLYDGRTGACVATIATEPGLAPQGAWSGERAAVLATGNPRVVDVSGRLIADIPLHGGVIAAIAADDAERRLIIVDVNRAVAWIDTSTWTVLDLWPGPWMHGALSPDGRLVAALAHDGIIHFAHLDGDRFAPAGQVHAHPSTIAITLCRDEIVTVGGGELRRAMFLNLSS